MSFPLHNSLGRSKGSRLNRRLVFAVGALLAACLLSTCEAHHVLDMASADTSSERADSTFSLLHTSGVSRRSLLDDHDDDHDDDHGDDHDDDDDGHEDDGPYEWSGIFETPKPTYVWTAQAKGDGYAAPHMKMVVLPATSASKSALHALDDQAKAAFETVCTEVEAGGLIAPGAGECYDLHFNISSTGEDHKCYNLDSTFTIDATTHAYLAFYTEHSPTEFERSQHYLKDAEGNDVEPGAEGEVTMPKSKKWGKAIGAAIIVNFVTLAGVIFMLPVVAEGIKKFPGSFTVITNAFASGALLAAAFFLLLYEATHLVEITDSRTEAEAASLWGMMILLGFLTPAVLDTCATACTTVQYSLKDSSNDEEGEHKMKLPDLDDTDEETSMRRRRVLVSVVVGDFMHNFADGVFIGTAFHTCGSSMGWTVTAASAFHELAQEVSDFVVLTDPLQGGLKPFKALLLNFLAGTSVILGVVVVLGIDGVTDTATGLILAFGGGVYIHLGATECMPKCYTKANNLKLRFLVLLAFVVGATAIGLVLLDDEHCREEGAGHEGH
eukprot:CAMPEP_0198212310 /NCGR_PEP_ID=MMETSP1445-20131203/25643_1 /TAXON_ID=36898 /ORGANISM="Pyramimonas sp., Strain CCMP2087" /LENGTH=552 /DNA_ID=CAMNT_0043886727 /DNA_START=176 /DNA_END=1834 /DNA_ORIENTATION=-